MPSVFAIDPAKVSALHDPILAETKRELDKVTGVKETPLDPDLIAALSHFSETALELLGAKGVPNPHNMLQTARDNIAAKDKACKDAMEEARAKSAGLKAHHPGKERQIDLTLKYYFREVNRVSRADMSFGTSLY